MYSESFEQNDTLHTLLNAFVSQLKIKSPYAIDANIIISDQINAFALPGGKIFVYSGIIEKMKSYEELVALLSHESSHVTHRHSLKSMSRSAAGSIVVATVFGDVGEISAGLISPKSCSVSWKLIVCAKTGRQKINEKRRDTEICFKNIRILSG